TASSGWVVDTRVAAAVTMASPAWTSSGGGVKSHACARETQENAYRTCSATPRRDASAAAQSTARSADGDPSVPTTTLPVGNSSVTIALLMQRAGAERPAGPSSHGRSGGPVLVRSAPCSGRDRPGLRRRRRGDEAACLQRRDDAADEAADVGRDR